MIRFKHIQLKEHGPSTERAPMSTNESLAVVKLNPTIFFHQVSVYHSSYKFKESGTLDSLTNRQANVFNVSPTSMRFQKGTEKPF